MHRQKLTRREISQFLGPIRATLLQLRSGVCDADQDGHIVFLDWQGEWSRVDYALNGHIALVKRVDPGMPLDGLREISDRLDECRPLTVAMVDQALRELSAHADRMIRCRRSELQAAVMTEQINVEFEDAGLKERDAA